MAAFRITVVGENFCANEVCCETLLDKESVQVISHSHEQIIFETKLTGAVALQCGDYYSNNISYLAQDPFVLATSETLDMFEFETYSEPAQLLTIWGLHFGSARPTVYVGGLNSTVVSHVSVNCVSALTGIIDLSGTGAQDASCYQTVIEVPPGEGRDNPIIISNGKQESNPDNVMYEFLTYKPPVVTSMALPSGSRIRERRNLGSRRELVSTGCCYSTSGQGLDNVVIDGSNFGTSGTVWLGFVGGIAMTPVSWSHTQVIVAVPEGEGMDLLLILETGGQSPEDLGHAISYAAPSFTSVVFPAEKGTLGGDVLILNGDSFGRPYSATCATDPNPHLCTDVPLTLEFETVVIDLDACVLLNNSHFQLQCSTPSGAGGGYGMTVCVRGQCTTVDGNLGLFSFDVPEILSITPNEVPTKGTDSEGAPLVMTITGKNFGAYDVCVKILNPLSTVGANVDFAIGQRAVTDVFVSNCRELDGVTVPMALLSDVSSHTEIQLHVPEYHGQNVELSVIAMGQRNAVPVTFSYTAPSVENVTSIRFIENVEVRESWTVGTSTPLAECAFCSLDNSSWANTGVAASTSACHISANDPYRGWGWKKGFEAVYEPSTQQFNYVRTLTWYEDPLCMGNLMFRTEQSGVISDEGQYLGDNCIRLLKETTTAVSLTPLTSNGNKRMQDICECSQPWVTDNPNPILQCLGSNANGECLLDILAPLAQSVVYRAYTIADRYELFMSTGELLCYLFSCFHITYYV